MAPKWHAVCLGNPQMAKNLAAPARVVGPFESGAEVRRAVGPIATTPKGRADLLHSVLDAAGVERAGYGERVLLWLASTSPETVGVIAGWIARSHGVADAAGLLDIAAVAKRSEGADDE